MNYISWAISYYTKDSEPLNFAYYYRLRFDQAITSIFSSILSGSFMHIFDGEFDEVLDKIRRTDDLNVIKLTPTHLQLLIDTGIKLGSVQKFILDDGALCSEAVRELLKIYKDNAEIYNEYGSTEATVGCIIYEVEPLIHIENMSSLPIGKPIFGNNIHILNGHQEPVPLDGIGEIFISGKSVAKGYLNDTILTNEKFLNDPFFISTKMYKTSDLGRLLPNGQIIYLGRKDRQVKIKGYRLELNDIENCLISFPTITSAAVTIKKTTHGDDVIAAYYCCEKEINIEMLFAYLRQKLPEYMVPFHIEYLKTLPINNNGKIDYAKLPDQFYKVNKENIVLQALI